MTFSAFDTLVFVLFLTAVVGISIYASRRERNSEDYFLAGRGLSWWLIGISLIASNISTEHFIGMAGSGFGNAGLAIASYEWFASITLVIVAIFFLPRFLRSGIYTMPEYLEYRYGPLPRAIMAVYMLLAYVGVAIAAVLYSGALALESVFHLPLSYGIWLIGGFAAAYTIYGGLKAVVWSDLIQGSALLIGGAIVSCIALEQAGGLSSFLQTNAVKLHVILPATDADIPWTSLLFGMWIIQFFYWGCNQFITQRTLASKSLAQGQMGIIFAAFLKLLIPFIVVFPGILAFQLYPEQITKPDEAYPVLISNILPEGFRGFLFAALFGAIMSSLDSMLNSASSIFTMDLYRRHLQRNASPEQLVRVGRIATAALVIAGCLLAPLPARFEGVYRYMQMIWGFISPGIAAVFLFGVFAKRAPAQAASLGLLLSVPVYGAFLAFLPEIAFLNHIGFTFAILIAVMTAITRVSPRTDPVELPEAREIDLTPARAALPAGIVVILLTIFLYIVFW